MRIERHGSGPRLYFGLHGWNGSAATFAPLMDDLPDDVSFWSVDLPGCGESASPVKWDLREIARQVAGEMPGPVTLAGNCSGAIVALLIAREFPDRVARVVMIDAFASWPWYFRLFLSRTIGRYAYWMTFANPVGRWLTNASLFRKRKAGTDLTHGFRRANHATSYRYLTMLRAVGGMEQFGELTIPIDILYGERTFGAIRDSARKWAAMWPQARTFELSGAGHLPLVEAALQVKQILFGEVPCSTQTCNRRMNFAR